MDTDLHTFDFEKKQANIAKIGSNFKIVPSGLPITANPLPANDLKTSVKGSVESLKVV